VPAAADEVSAGIAHLFSSYAQDFHGLAGQAAAFNDQFVQHMHAGAFSYASIEADIVAALNNVLKDIGLGGLANFSTTNTNLDITLALALLELAIVIPVLVLTSPIWIPLLVLASPLLLLGLLLLAGFLA
jgi:hypothetical protein